MLYNFLTLIVDLEPWVQNFYEYQGNFLNVCTYCHYSKITENNDKEEILKKQPKGSYPLLSKDQS